MAQPYSFFKTGNAWTQRQWNTSDKRGYPGSNTPAGAQDSYSTQPVRPSTISNPNQPINMTSMMTTNQPGGLNQPASVIGAPGTNSGQNQPYNGQPVNRPAQPTNPYQWYGGQGNPTNPTPNPQPTGQYNIPNPSNPLTPGTAAGNYLAGLVNYNPAFLASTDWATSILPGAEGMRNGYQQWVSTVTPYMQLMQNAYQYGQDFNEAQRRWNEQTAWQQAADQYNMSLSGRQQDMAEWQAQEAARQWQQNMGYQQQRDAAEMGLTRDMTMQQVWGRNQMPNVRWVRSFGG